MSERTFSFYAKNPSSGTSRQPAFIARDPRHKQQQPQVSGNPHRQEPDRRLHPQFQNYNVSHFQEREIKVSSSLLLSDRNNNNHKPRQEDHAIALQDRRATPFHSATQLLVKPSSNRIPVSVEIHTPVSGQSNSASHVHHHPHKRQRRSSSGTSNMAIYSILGESQHTNRQSEGFPGAVTRIQDPPTTSPLTKLATGVVPSHLMNGRPVGIVELSSKNLETIAEEQNPVGKHVRIDMDSVSGTRDSLTPHRNIKTTGKSFLPHGHNESSEEIEALPPELNSKRRRSSLMSLDLKFFKNRISSASTNPYVGQSNRTSIISRLSFSSEHDPTLRVTNFNKLTDLRRILNPEEEKEDWLDVFWSKFNTCDWFEWNLNNAAVLITLAVFVVTILLIIRTIFNRM